MRSFEKFIVETTELMYKEVNILTILYIQYIIVINNNNRYFLKTII